MEFSIKPLMPNEAAKLSNILQKYPCSAIIKTKANKSDLNNNVVTNQWVMDAKSLLGLLAICEVAKEGEKIILEVDEFDNDKDMIEVTKKITELLK